MINYTIYGLYDLSDDPEYKNIRYIGQTTTTLKERLAGHKRDSRSATERYVCRWVKKVGEDQIGILSLEEGEFVSDEHLDEREIFHINKGIEDGLDLKNLTIGGRGTRGYIWPDELVERRSGEGNSFYGKTHTEETKALLSSIRKEQWKDPEYAAKMTEEFFARGGFAGSWAGGETHPMWGKQHKDSTKELISEASKSFWSNRTPEQREEHRQASVEAMHRRWHVKRDIIKPDCVYCQTTETNESEQTWNSPSSSQS